MAAAQGSAENSKTNAVNQFFEEIPIEGKLNEIAQETHIQLLQNPFGIQPSTNEQLADQFSRAFTTDALLADARAAFHQSYNAAHASSAMQWLNSRDIQHVLETEKEFYTLQGIRKRVVKKYELEQDPPSQNRVELIQSVARNRSAGESEVESQVIIYRALVSALGELSDQQSFTESQVDGFVNNYRSQIGPQVDQEVTNELLLMYHGLEDDALKKYGAFYETEPGKWLSSVTSGSIHAAYRAASNRFLESLNNQ